jgi:NOL1/NOP2/sun family putative RNA methylase
MAMYSSFLLERYRALFSAEEVKTLDAAVLPAIRVNTLRAEERELVERLRGKGVELEKIPWTRHGYFVKSSPFSIGATTEYLLGYYFLQDPASMYACEVLEPRERELVLDMAAAPGGKTTYLAQLMNNKGTIVAVELNRERMKSLRSNVSRLGVENVIAIRTNALEAGKFGLVFDKVLLDAPCTGTGTAYKNPEAREKARADVEKCTATQRALLEVAVRVLKKGGTLVYCTCSFLPEENEFIVQDTMKKFGLELEEIRHGVPAFTSCYGRALSPELAKARRFYPATHSTQGFFIAKLKKYKG